MTMLLAALLALAGNRHSPSLQSERAVLAAEVAICRGYERNDVATIRRSLTDDYTLTDSKGTVTTKQDDIDDVVKQRVHCTTFRNRNMKVRLYRGVAIVIGPTEVKGQAGGASVDLVVQFTDTLALIDGRWMLAAGHVSRLQS